MQPHSHILYFLNSFPAAQHDRRLYHVQVAVGYPSEKGIRDVTARVYNRGNTACHDLGKIGTATAPGDATRRFGQITWLANGLTIGGTDGVKTTLFRKEFEMPSMTELHLSAAVGG
jgi:hypothetical protein